MASTPLPNYLLANRKRLALSQDDVAFLLGTKSGTKVSRYERFVREPSLQTALECEAVFQRSVSELFSGMYNKAEQDVAARAKMLIELERRPAKLTAQTKRKRESLINITSQLK